MKCTIVGIDLAKNDVYMFGINSEGQKVLDRKCKKSEIEGLLKEVGAEVVIMEACGGAHFWGRVLRSKYEVRLIAPQHVKPFVGTHKNDRNDARAIVEAGRRIGAVFVSIKETWQQDLQALHRIRERRIRARVALSNQIRGLLMEYGFLIPKGKEKVRPYVLEYLSEDEGLLSEEIKQEIHELYEELLWMEKREEDLELKIKAESKSRPECLKLEKLKGVGPMVSTAFVASVGNPRVFKNGRQLAAWVGLVPRQCSTGGKTKLLGISKSGDSYLRKTIIQGARAQVIGVKRKEHKTKEDLRILEMLETKGFNKTAVAQANRNARKMWAILAN